MVAALTETEVLGRPESRLLSDGRRREGGAGGTFPVENPATGQVLRSVADGTPSDAPDEYPERKHAAVGVGPR